MSDVSEETVLEEPGLASRRTLLRSFSTLAVGEMLARLAGLLALILLARRLLPYGFGLIILGTTLLNWFAIVADSGTEVITTRNVSRQPERFRSIVDYVLGLRLALSVIAAALFVAVVLITTGGGLKASVLLPFALALPALALNLRWILIGVEAPRSVAIGNISSQVLLTAGVVLLITGEDSVREVPFLRVAAEFLYAAIVLGSLARRFGVPRPRIDIQIWRTTLAQSLPLLATNIARTMLYSADLLLIAVILGSKQTGFYGAAYKPVLFMAGINALYSTSFLSSLSAARSQGTRDRLTSSALRAGIGISVPIAGFATLAAPMVVPILYGHAYDSAIAPLAILAWSVPLIAVGVPYAGALLAADRQDTLMRHSALAAGLNVAANLVAIPLLGIDASAAITLASFALVLALNHRSSTAMGLVPPIGDALRKRRQPHGAMEPSSSAVER
jgi:O-antigen/teichoic acid export membrane protein